MAWLFFHQLLQRGVKGTVSPSTTRTKNALSKPPEVTVHVPSFQKGTDAASWLHLYVRPVTGKKEQRYVASGRCNCEVSVRGGFRLGVRSRVSALVCTCVCSCTHTPTHTMGPMSS